MASAWGSSWGSAWGNNWGATSVAPTAYHDPGGIPDPQGGKFWRDKWKQQQEGEKPPAPAVVQLPPEIAAITAPAVIPALPDADDEDAIEALLKVLELI